MDDDAEKMRERYGNWAQNMTESDAKSMLDWLELMRQKNKDIRVTEDKEIQKYREKQEYQRQKYANLKALDKEIQGSNFDAFFLMKRCDSPL